MSDTATIIREEAERAGVSRYVSSGAIDTLVRQIDGGTDPAAAVREAVRNAGGSTTTYDGLIQSIARRVDEAKDPNRAPAQTVQGGPQDGAPIQDATPASATTVQEYADRLRTIASRMGLSPQRVEAALAEAGMTGEDAAKPALTVVPTLGDDALAALFKDASDEVLASLKKIIKRLDKIAQRF